MLGDLVVGLNVDFPHIPVAAMAIHTVGTYGRVEIRAG